MTRTLHIFASGRTLVSSSHPSSIARFSLFSVQPTQIPCVWQITPSNRNPRHSSPMSNFTGGFHLPHQHPSYPHPAPQPLTFTFSEPNSKIFDSTISDSYGSTPFSIHSSSFYNAAIYQFERTRSTLKGADGAVIAVVDWEHSSPRVLVTSVGGGGKVKCKEWFPYDKATR